MSVILAQAGVPLGVGNALYGIPAFAGMTTYGVGNGLSGVPVFAVITVARLAQLVNLPHIIVVAI